MKYTGTIEELIEIVQGFGIYAYLEDKENCKKIGTHQGDGILNWYESTGTLQFQGKLEAKRELEDLLEQHLGG